jgi:hyperosmotically inducible protein
MKSRSIFRAGVVLLGLSGSFVLLSVVGFAKDGKHHQDAFTNDPNDTQVSKRVRHELLTLPYYNVFDDLAYRIDGSTVTLLGSVTRPTLKRDAENAVKRVEGVTRVVNEIEVLPVSPMDDDTRRAVFRAIFTDQSLSRYGMGAVTPIHIIVKNGNVTLEGVVDNQADKELAYIRASGVANVFSVTNDLQVGK